jgi:hypothetical protein
MQLVLVLEQKLCKKLRAKGKCIAAAHEIEQVTVYDRSDDCVCRSCVRRV